MTILAYQRYRNAFSARFRARAGGGAPTRNGAERCHSMAMQFGLVAHLGGGAIVTLQTLDRGRARRLSDKRPPYRSAALP